MSAIIRLATRPVKRPTARRNGTGTARITPAPTAQQRPARSGTARLVDALTGEGIHNAVLSGVLAGESVERALAANDVSYGSLRSYEDRIQHELGASIRRSYRWQKYVAAFPPVLEALFIGAGVFRGRVTRWLDRISTDYRVAQ